MMERVVAYVAAVCLTAYWGWVLIKLYRLGRKIGKDPNAIPREFVGQMMRVVWYPCILVLLAAMWIAATGGRHVQTLSMFTPIVEATTVWWGLVFPATVACVFCTVATFVCWRKMGRSWRIGIDPGERLELVSTGPYRFVRHPIYALRMLLNVCVCVMVPTPLVILMCIVDIVLLQVEARREERYMESVHGSVYANYKNSVGRFMPRIAG